MLGALAWTVFIFLSLDKLSVQAPMLSSATVTSAESTPSFRQPSEKLPIHLFTELISVEIEETEQESEPTDKVDFFTTTIHSFTSPPFITSGASNAYFLAFGTFCNTPLYLLFHCLKSDLA